MPATILTWLARACKATRENADITLAQVADAAGKNPSNIYRFEEGETTPRDVETVVAAYAKEVGVPAQLLWADALGLWGRAQSHDTEMLRVRALRSTQESRNGREPTLEALAMRLDNIARRIDGEDTVAFETIFRNSSDAIAILNRELSYRRVNAQWAKIGNAPKSAAMQRGLPAAPAVDEFIGAKLGSRISQEAADRLVPLCAKALAGAPTYNEKVVAGERTWLTSVFPFDVPPMGVIILATEITAQEKIAQLLQTL